MPQDKKKAAPEPSPPSWDALGEFIRTQRRLANLSLRDLASLLH